MVRPADKTILVVDDEPNVRQYLETVLSDAGFNVVTAADGEEAWAAIRRQPPDFISLDLVMPRKSGHKLLCQLKRDRQLSRIPVLVVTAHARDELGQSDLNDLLDNRVMSGPGTYLEKPVNPRTYVRSIKRALGIVDDTEGEDQPDLKEKLRRDIENADPEALRKALAVLQKGNQGD